MMSKLPKLVATSVVRGSEKGQSHGGVYLIDFAEQRVEQKIDWNTGNRYLPYSSLSFAQLVALRSQ